MTLEEINDEITIKCENWQSELNTVEQYILILENQKMDTKPESLSPFSIKDFNTSLRKLEEKKRELKMLVAGAMCILKKTGNQRKTALINYLAEKI